MEDVATLPELRRTAAERVAEAYAEHRDLVFRLALRYGAGRRAFAEDVTHDVFVKLLRAIDTLEDRGALGGWLYRVTTNLCLSRLERERFRRSVLELIGRAEPSTPSLEATCVVKDELTRAIATLEALPPKERVVLTMLHLDDRSQAEICQILGLSKGYVSKLVDRGTERIRAARARSEWRKDR